MMHGTTGSTIDVLQTVGATVSARPSPLLIKDDFLPEREHKLVRDYLSAGGWKFGWKSRASKDEFSFWHKHYAGHKKTGGEKEEPYPCADELRKTSPLLHACWLYLQGNVLKGHTLYRCYANGQTYGSDGTLHTDSKSPNASTSIYYPAETWEPNWAGETVLFNADKSDILAIDLSKAEPAGDISGQHAARRARRVPHLPGAARRAGL